MTPEARVLTAIVRYLHCRRQAGHPIFWIKLHGGPMQRAGMPDLLVIFYGHALAIEVKRPGGKATRLQNFTLSEMESAGATCAVVSCVQDVDAILRAAAHAAGGKCD